jgi:cell division protein FtsZ
MPADPAPRDPALDLIASIVRAITEPFVQQPQLPALDFADMRTAFLDGGLAAFGQGEAEGEDRAIKAAERAIADLKRAIREDQAE